MDKREAYKSYKLGNLATEYFNVTSALRSKLPQGPTNGSFVPEADVINNIWGIIIKG